jgi:hypothetical protein
MSKETVNAAADIKGQFGAVFLEALQTHGAMLTMAALSAFTAEAVHQAEHLSDNEYARQIVLGNFTAQFNRYLHMLNKSCDESQRPAPFNLSGITPEGEA